MPVIRISMATGRTDAQKKKVALEITESIARCCDSHAEHVYVIFDDVPPNNWTVGGETITERKAKRNEK